MIKLLDKSVYELIAAGEVIEKPSSVIKELVENAIDAGAARITVEIKNGGITYMRVTDDGCGMAFEEVPVAFLRHATSKLSAAEELDNISTLGFRGEALASVAAVSKTEVLTKRQNDPLGTSYHIEGGEETLHEQTGCPDGTTIIMRDLFFNTPARLKFLKKDSTEGNYVQSVVDKLALSYPDIAFSFIRDGKTVLVTSGDGKLFSAVHSVFGKQFSAALSQVDYEQNHIKVSGYITTPYACRGNRQMQYFFVNGRWVHNTTCTAALEEGYKNSIMVGKFPACILKISMPPSDVDVNVSPSKTEVRFANEKAVFETVYLAVKNGILNGENKKEINIGGRTAGGDETFDTKTNPQIGGVYGSSFASAHTSPYNNEHKEKKETPLNIGENALGKDGDNTVKKPRTEEKSFAGRMGSYKAVYKPLPPKNIFIQEVIAGEREETETSEYKFIDQSSFIKASSDDEKKLQTADPVVDEKYKPEIRYIGELFKTYIICECGDKVILIDKHAAHERLRFEQLKKEIRSSSQLLTEGLKVTLSMEEMTALSDNIDYLESLGIELSFNSDTEAEILGFPAVITDKAPEELLLRIAEILINGGDDIEGELFDGILHSFACKGAIKANEPTSDMELEQLAKRVWEDTAIRYCPHGRPIITTLSKYNIERNFGRIQ
ncbi:MAG TPA: DNA mismatch repair endonuclease MutL [Ruminococcaceae bacterium]|nr:DNA mismatch repair endonuclease MutL [Oscillospiraceae bacterium]